MIINFIYIGVNQHLINTTTEIVISTIYNQMDKKKVFKPIQLKDQFNHF